MNIDNPLTPEVIGDVSPKTFTRKNFINQTLAEEVESNIQELVRGFKKEQEIENQRKSNLNK